MSDTNLAGGETQVGGAGLETNNETLEQGTEESSSNLQPVSVDTHRRLLSQMKKVKEKYEQAEAERVQLQEAKLMAEGKKDELIQQLREQLGKARESRESDHVNFARRSVDSYIKTQAKQMGCVDPDAFLKLAELPPDILNEDYSVNSVAAKQALEEGQKRHPWMWKKEAAPTKDLPPSTVEPGPGKVGLDNLNGQQLAEAISKSLGQR